MVCRPRLVVCHRSLPGYPPYWRPAYPAKPGIRGWNEKANIEIVQTICAYEEYRPGSNFQHLITYVKDRPGHDRRYAINAQKIERELNWKPAETFDTGIRKTVAWYLNHPQWIADIQTGAYRTWLEKNYHGRQ